MRRESQKGNHEKGLYYICNFAHTYSSFSILVNEVSTDQKYTLLENGFSYSEEIENFQNSMSAQDFIYQVPKLDFGEEDVKIWFYLEVASGPIPRMAIRYCNSYQSGTAEEALTSCSQEIVQLSAEDVISRSKSASDA
jgi:hypothetical protein